ncbi:MAG: hypothetical protein ABIH34_00380 [Nanoarchaeota archaeon]
MTFITQRDDLLYNYCQENYAEAIEDKDLHAKLRRLIRKEQTFIDIIRKQDRKGVSAIMQAYTLIGKHRDQLRKTKGILVFQGRKYDVDKILDFLRRWRVYLRYMERQMDRIEHRLEKEQAYLNKPSIDSFELFIKEWDKEVSNTEELNRRLFKAKPPKTLIDRKVIETLWTHLAGGGLGGATAGAFIELFNSLFSGSVGVLPLIVAMGIFSAGGMVITGIVVRYNIKDLKKGSKEVRTIEKQFNIKLGWLERRLA